MKVRTLYLVRHGAVEQVQRFWGWTDVPLSQEGHRQAGRLGQLAPLWKLDRIVGSDLLRVRQTAQPLLAATGLEWKACADLRECNFGEWEGLSWEEIRQREPQRAEDFASRWLTATPHGGESVEQMDERVQRAWQSLWQQPWQRLALIGHAGTNRLLLLRLLGLPLNDLFRLGQDYACWSRVDFFEGAPTLVRLNVPVEDFS